MLQTIYGPLEPPAVGRRAASSRSTRRNSCRARRRRRTACRTPATCTSRKPAKRAAPQPCRLTVALHGCLQSAEILGTEFYTKIGVNEWADTNRIIVLYPQAHATTVAELPAQNALAPLNTNPHGCWNWWGYAATPST